MKKAILALVILFDTFADADTITNYVYTVSNIFHNVYSESIITQKVKSSHTDYYFTNYVTTVTNVFLTTYQTNMNVNVLYENFGPYVNAASNFAESASSFATSAADSATDAETYMSQAQASAVESAETYSAVFAAAADGLGRVNDHIQWFNEHLGQLVTNINHIHYHAEDPDRIVKYSEVRPYVTYSFSYNYSGSNLMYTVKIYTDNPVIFSQSQSETTWSYDYTVLYANPSISGREVQYVRKVVSTALPGTAKLSARLYRDGWTRCEMTGISDDEHDLVGNMAAGQEVTCTNNRYYSIKLVDNMSQGGKAVDYFISSDFNVYSATTSRLDRIVKGSEFSPVKDAVESLTGRVAAIETELPTIKAGLSALSNLVAAVEDDVASLTDRIAAVEAKLPPDRIVRGSRPYVTFSFYYNYSYHQLMYTVKVYPNQTNLFSQDSTETVYAYEYDVEYANPSYEIKEVRWIRKEIPKSSPGNASLWMSVYRNGWTTLKMDGLSDAIRDIVGGRSVNQEVTCSNNRYYSVKIDAIGTDGGTVDYYISSDFNVYNSGGSKIGRIMRDTDWATLSNWVETVFQKK